MSIHETLPTWVIKRDTRVAPFDEDKICSSIFAAGEQVIGPNPFLARELTDGVLHFLRVDRPVPSMPTTDIAEAVVKVVRELGQPILALRYDQYRATRLARRDGGPGGGALPANRRSPTVDDVYPPDLLAAEREGLLHFLDLDSPRELVGGVLAPAPVADRPVATGWVEAIEEARNRIGQYIAIDGPEYLLANRGSPSQTWAWVRELRIGLRLTGLQAVVNLNCQIPPACAVANADGPLFAAVDPKEVPRFGEHCDTLLDHVLDGAGDNVRVDWHLNERDFEPAGRSRLLKVAKRVIEGAPIAFVSDRHHGPIALAKGLDRDHTSVAGVVGISLTRLADVVGVGSGATTDPNRYLSKLGSLMRLALSAGRARRVFLRRHARPQTTQGFAIHRGRYVIEPLGLAEVVQQLTGHPLAFGSPGLDFARQVLQNLRTAIDPHSSGDMIVCLDDSPPALSGKRQNAFAAGGTRSQVGTPRQQIRTAGALHVEVGAGTAEVLLPHDHLPAPEGIAHLLWQCWHQPGLVRVRFLRDLQAAQQLTAGWDVQPAQ